MADTSYGKLKCNECESFYPRCQEIDGKRRWNHRLYCPICKPNKPTAKSWKVSEPLFREIIKESFGIREALQKMGLEAAGGNYASFHRRVKELGIDTSHFTGQAHMRGKTFGPKKPLSYYFEGKAIISSDSLKRRILSEGLKDHKCEECGLDWWLYDKIPLELHHVNGNHSDNAFENLQLLCPNCHALTDNYRGRAQSRAINKESRILLTPPIIKTPEEVNREKTEIQELKATKTKEKLKNRKPYIHKTKIVWPSDNELVEILWNKSTSQFARENSLSSNAVKRHCERRNLPVPSLGFWRKRETGADVSALLIPYLEYKKKVTPPELESGYPSKEDYEKF